MYLCTHSYYSWRYGIVSERELVDWAVAQGVSRLALTDINSTAGSLNYLRLAQEAGLSGVLGVDFRDGVDQLWVALARDHRGWCEICSYLSYHLRTDRGIDAEPPLTEHVFIIYPYDRVPQRALLSHEYIGVATGDIRRIGKSIWNYAVDRYVAFQPMSFRARKEHNIHRLLRAVDQNVVLSRTRQQDIAPADELFYTPAEMRACYADAPVLLSRAERLLEECASIDMGWGRPKNLACYTGSSQEDFLKVRSLCEEGIRYRYQDLPPEILYARLDKELRVISEKGFLSYFLISWDMLRYARSRGYYYVGRGSGANSLVAFLLGITDVDPIELDLYFERFINLFRDSPPDFDIDFSWLDRDDMYRYIFDRYDHVALLGTYSTFQYRAAVRELGKVFGLAGTEIDRLTATGLDVGSLDRLQRQVLSYSEAIIDFPSHMSIHAGGVLIADQDINYYTAMSYPPKGLPVTQMDMHIAEDVGLHKYDILSQRGLGKIKDAVALVKQNQPEAPAPPIHDIRYLMKDPAIRDVLQSARAIGCFYVESPAMRMLLSQLQVRDYLGLLAASSIIRPGVAKSGMMRQYILRDRQPERREDAPELMLELMPETYGVMVYQEDVIKVAHHYGGLSLGEADVLRRGMSGKYRSRAEFERVREQFFMNCRDQGRPEREWKEIWRQIESFAGYAFAKGHSASYAVESYQSLYLKAHYPLEYMVATINNYGGFYRTEFYVHEARMCGGTIHPPCIQHSRSQTHIEGEDIYLGYQHLRALESSTIQRIIQAREGGRFLSLDNFLDRVPITVDQISPLIRIDAFRSLGIPRRELLWQAYAKIGGQPPQAVQQRLFDPARRSWQLPTLSHTDLEDAYAQIELLGFPLQSPYHLVAEELPSQLVAEDLPRYLDREVTICGYLVTIKNTRTVRRELMQFGTFLDSEGCWIDTVHFPPVAKAYPFRGPGIYALRGKVVVEWDFYSIEVSSLRKLDFIPDPRYAELSHNGADE